jgi:methylated-DNA-[protein]-cysteine S-methyltransferase
LRSTPQRRAIFAAFRGGVSEHLSADEVYSRASASLPDLGRGTVYATLAEFAEVGLLAAFGTPEPVRYEINIDRHAHFRCRLCGRLFDIEGEAPNPQPFTRHGFEVEEIELRAEGVCRDCVEFGVGLDSGVEVMFGSGVSDLLQNRESAAVELQTPLGPLVIAATNSGIARVAFADHGDVAFLRSLVGRDVSQVITDHLVSATLQLEGYFKTGPSSFDCEIDWDVVRHYDELRATMDIPYGTVRSYHLLKASSTPREIGHAFGINPVPILTPCHRVARGSVIPDRFVGGPERREWLLRHERQFPALA